MNKKILSIGFFLLLIIIIISGCFEKSNESSADDSYSDPNYGQKNNGGDSSEEVKFTEHLFELDKTNYIVPLGELEGGWEEMEVNNMALVHIKREGEGLLKVIKFDDEEE